MALLTVGAPNAWGADTGGAAAGTVSKAKHATKAPATPVVPPGAAPITAASANITYKGPVYERNAAGQVVPYVGATTLTAEASGTGGSAVGTITPTKPELLVPGTRARYVEGLAAAPMSAPAAVQDIIWAGNEIVGLPYIYGGGHASFVSPGYDCSGTVSFALHGADLLTQPEDSSEFMGWGSVGVGRWVTIFSNPEHAYMTVAGLRLDTSPAEDPSDRQGPRWRPLRHTNAGYTVRHPLGGL
jgi:cell wall-associated NlpC family hydrolase